MPHMPEFGDGSKSGAVEGGKTMKVETVYGHARKQTAQVSDGQHGEATENLGEPMVEAAEIIQRDAAKGEVTGDDVWAVEVPLAVFENAKMHGDTRRDGQDGQMPSLTHSHVVRVLLNCLACLLPGCVDSALDSARDAHCQKNERSEGQEGSIENEDAEITYRPPLLHLCVLPSRDPPLALHLTQTAPLGNIIQGLGFWGMFSRTRPRFTMVVHLTTIGKVAFYKYIF